MQSCKIVILIIILTYSRDYHGFVTMDSQSVLIENPNQSIWFKQLANLVIVTVPNPVFLFLTMTVTLDSSLEDIVNPESPESILFNAPQIKSKPLLSFPFLILVIYFPDQSWELHLGFFVTQWDIRHVLNWGI